MITKFKLFEYILPNQANREDNAVQTVIDRLRNVAWVHLSKTAVDLILENNPHLNAIKILEEGTTPYKNYVDELSNGGWGNVTAKRFAEQNHLIYVNTPEGKKQAEELAQLIRSNDGFAVRRKGDLLKDIKDEKRVGELLEYDPLEIKAYLQRNYPPEIFNKIF